MAPTNRTTVAYRICAWCEATLGVAHWPWTGEPTTRTHGMCGSCQQALCSGRGAASTEAPLRLAASET